MFQTADFAVFTEKSTQMAQEVASRVGYSEKRTCESPAWLLFLLLLLPCILVLFAPCCIRKKKYVRKVGLIDEKKKKETVLKRNFSNLVELYFLALAKIFSKVLFFSL